jgi:hypothetical protein
VDDKAPVATAVVGALKNAIARVETLPTESPVI